MKALLALLLVSEPALAEPLTPQFLDASSGLPSEHIYAGGWEHFVGGGVAVFDCNGDTRPDIFAAGGEAPSHLFINQTEGPKKPLSFAGTPPLNLTHVTGAYPLDIDGDGHLDLAVLRVGPNVFLKGDGACGFTDHTKVWGLTNPDRWSTAFSATWELGRDLPTIAVGNYVDRADPDGPFEACDENALYRGSNEKYDDPIALSPGYCALSMLFSDWQRNGEPELRISNDRHYYVRGGFEEMWQLNPLKLRGESEGWKKVSLWGMGIASGDLNADGFPDVMLTSMGDQLLQFNDGAQFVNAPYSVGTYAQLPHIGDEGRPSTGWHAEFADVNNDGLLDLFIAKGNVDQMPSNASADPNNLLIQRPDGTFVETAAAAGVATMDRARGAALADFDGDGRLDLVVNNRRAALELWQNVTPNTGNWLQVSLANTSPNTFGIGAWIELREENGITQSREVVVGGGHAGGAIGAHHFGLGAAVGAEVRVIWPDGTKGDWLFYAANQQISIVR